LGRIDLNRRHLEFRLTRCLSVGGNEEGGHKDDERNYRSHEGRV
jgi:hypothetical protein